MEIVTTDEILRAALDFVEDFDGATLTTLAPTKRLRLDVLTMRERVDELQRRVDLLERKRRDVTSEWKQLARCQRHRRRRAEVENKQLRAQVCHQAVVTKRLLKLLALSKRSWDECLLAVLARGHRALVPRVQPACSREKLIQTARPMFGQLSAIFSLSHFAAPTEGQGQAPDAPTRTATKRGQVVELFDSRPMPFEFQTVGDATWHYMAHHQVPGEVFVAKDVEVTDALLEREFTFQCKFPSSGQPCVFRSRAVALRYRLPNAVAIMWVVDVESQVGDESSRRAFSTTEKVWVLLQPTAASTRSITLTQTYLISTPSSRATSAQKRNAQALEASLECNPNHVTELWSQVESVMLDNSWTHNAGK